MGPAGQKLTVLGATIGLAVAGGVLSPGNASSSPGWNYVQAFDPVRALVTDSHGVLLATLTNGSRSVVLTGPTRTFSENGTTVETTSWVRLLATPFLGEVDTRWLRARLADRSPDVLAFAAQYITGAPTIIAADGSMLAADASYGPLVDGVRQEGSDWNDFLQVDGVYDGVVDPPELAQAGALDCSGFVRMVFGVRAGHAMVLTPDGVRLPRRAADMDTYGPGTLLARSPTRLTDLSRLLPGDLVLFDASVDDGTAVDHVGIYLGNDTTGHPRFVSSRKTPDGPTFGDLGGRSTLDGVGLYATSLRAERRI